MSQDQASEEARQDIFHQILINSLHTLTVTQRPHADRDSVCTICVEPFQPDQFLLQHQAPCNNSWHSECLLTWIDQFDRTNPTCPACRQRLRTMSSHNAAIQGEVVHDEMNDYPAAPARVNLYLWISDFTHMDIATGYITYHQLEIKGIYVAYQGWITVADLPDNVQQSPLFQLDESFPRNVTSMMQVRTFMWERDNEGSIYRRQGPRHYRIYIVEHNTTGHHDPMEREAVYR